MEQKAFDLIVEKVHSVLLEQGFERKGDVREEQGQATIYLGEDIAYSVLYGRKTRLSHLCACRVADGSPDNQWRKLSTWAFDPESGSAVYTSNIAGDFAGTPGGSDRKALIYQQRKRKKKGEDAAIDPQFLSNCLAGVLLRLRAKLAQEKGTYEAMYSVTLTCEHVVGRMEQFVKTHLNNEPFGELRSVLNDMYENGDMGVRSITTIVLFDGINDQQALENPNRNFSEDPPKVYARTGALRDKKVRPEEKKRKPKYSGGTLQTLDDHV